MPVRSTLTTGEGRTLWAASAGGVALLVNTLATGGDPLVASLGLTIIGSAMTYAMIVWTGPSVMRRGLKGKDMSKVVQEEM